MLLPPDTRHWDQWQLAHCRSTGHSFNETGETSRHKPTKSVESMDLVFQSNIIILSVVYLQQMWLNGQI